jgi:quinol monooxygenase YgiN
LTAWKQIQAETSIATRKRSKTMLTVGVLARFEFKPGNEPDVERFFQEGLAIVQQQKASTVWFALRLGPTTFGAFAAFTNEEERHTLLSVGGPAVAQRYSSLFAQPPTFEKVDVLAAKLPKGENRLTLGSLVRFEGKPGKDAEFENFLKEVLSDVRLAPGTTVWFALRMTPSTFGVFDAFPDEDARQTHFAAGFVRAEQAADLLEHPPTFEKVDVFAAKLPG